ncbi:MAG: electron transport complex subunit E [Spirochaetaceae bacterium]|jgi:electron transport complex protein RnfE|nr:electron transport complex subunit E [Spirochaetaceae bacterium]
MSQNPQRTSRVRIFLNGLVKENPLLILMIGLCSSLAVTTEVVNGIGMGLSMTFVLLMSEIVISLFRRLIPNSIRIPVFIIVIAAFTTVIDYVLKAQAPDLSKAMGVFIPLIVVNCIIMGRVESFASKQPLDYVIPDSLGMGLGYTWVLTGISAIRELLGNGTFLGREIFDPAIDFLNGRFPGLALNSYQPVLFFTLPPGGFFVFALFISFNLAINAKKSRTAPCPAAGCGTCGQDAPAGCAAPGQGAPPKAGETGGFPPPGPGVPAKGGPS